MPEGVLKDEYPVLIFISPGKPPPKAKNPGFLLVFAH
jgi:hypothetical protein